MVPGVRTRPFATRFQYRPLFMGAGVNTGIAIVNSRPAMIHMPDGATQYIQTGQNRRRVTRSVHIRAIIRARRGKVNGAFL